MKQVESGESGEYGEHRDHGVEWPLVSWPRTQAWSTAVGIAGTAVASGRYKMDSLVGPESSGVEEQVGVFSTTCSFEFPEDTPMEGSWAKYQVSE